MATREFRTNGFGGTTQADRWPRPLDPAYAPLDDRSLFELFDFACRFSSLVVYYGPDNRAAGDWVEFLTRDPLITLGSIVATDVRRTEQRLSWLARRTRAERNFAAKRARLVRLCDGLLDLPRQVERWHRGLSVGYTSDLALQWRATIGQTIDHGLRPLVQRLRACDLGAGLSGALDRPLGLDYSDFSATWQLDDVVPDASLYVGRSGAERIDRFLPRVLPLWPPMADLVAHWVAAAGPQLAAALNGGGRVEPHLSLFVAFARLFATAQDSLNALGSRRTEFYYRQVLREHNRPATPDAVYVGFRQAPSREPQAVTVPAGTRLDAGKDSAGRDVVYESQHAMTVTSAALSRVLTVRVVSGPIGAMRDGPAVPQRVLAREAPAGVTGQEGWATFGSTEDEPADLGFAVSSPTLRLSGGARTIRLDMRHAPPVPTTGELLAALGRQAGVTAADVFNQVLEQAFTLSVSTPEGWFQVGTYQVVHEDDRRLAAFSMLLTLGPEAPAVVSFSDASGATIDPTVRAHLRQQPVVISGPSGPCSVYALSVLHSLRITAVRVQTTATGLPGIRVFNTDGEVDLRAPVSAFGAVPTVGSSLRIKHDELFSKRAERITLRLQWFDLPVNRTGFAGYYRQYVVDPDGIVRERLFDNQSFRAALSVERPGWWTLRPVDDGDAFLFRTLGRPDGPPDPDGTLDDVTVFDRLATTGLPSPPTGYQPFDSAIRVELRRPAYGFGTSLFAPNMLQAVLNGIPGGGTSDAACRAEYAAVAEAKRRLQNLLGAGGFRRSDAILDSLSPAPRPGAASRLQTAYRDLTDSWRAYLRRRPGTDTPSDWIVRNQQSDIDGGQDSGTTRDQSYERVVQSTLQAAVRALLEVASACLAECVTAAQDRMDPTEWQVLRDRLDAAGREDARQQLSALRGLHGRIAAADAGGAASSAAMKKCQAVLLAASLVHDCDVNADHLDNRYATSVRVNLRTCIGMLHSLYDASVQQCKEDRTTATWHPVPNPPHLPRLQALTVDYTASSPGDFSHLLPFGGTREQPVATADPPTLIPQFANAGNLYLGLSGLTTPQTLRLFVRMGQRAGSRGGGEDVAWEYLSGSRWIRLTSPYADVDTTQGLRRSGILSLVLPAIEREAVTILPAGCQWLRAVVQSDPDAFPHAMGFLLHVVTAVRLSADSAQNLERPLAPNTIRGLVKPVKGIGSVLQPAASFGGRARESDRAMQTRVSERLRHKGRAILPWDYERLVLEQFPTVWKARALPARRRRAGEPAGTGPGHVRIVIVPGPDCADVTDPAAPLAGRDFLDAIEAALAAVAGPGVQIHVVNPVYLRLRVSARIQWRANADPHMAALHLNTALVEYLSSWRDVPPHHEYWSETEIQHFVRSQSDVESLASIDFEYEAAGPADADREVCLVTSAATHHIITSTAAAVSVMDGY